MGGLINHVEHGLDLDPQGVDLDFVVKSKVTSPNGELESSWGFSAKGTVFAVFG